MVRHMMATLTVLLATAAIAQAQLVPVPQGQPLPQPIPQGTPQISGRIKSVHPEKRHLVIYLPDGKEMLLDLAPDVRVYSTYTQGRLRRLRTVTVEVANGIASLQPNTPVLLTTVAREGRPHVVEIRIEGAQRVR